MDVRIYFGRNDSVYQHFEPLVQFGEKCVGHIEHNLPYLVSAAGECHQAHSHDCSGLESGINEYIHY